MNKIGVLVTASIVLAGCSSSDNSLRSNDSNGYQYRCDDDHQFSVSYLIEEQGALVRVQDVEYALVQAPSGSGTRYILPQNALLEGTPVTLYTKGPYARLEYGREVYRNCQTGGFEGD